MQEGKKGRILNKRGGGGRANGTYMLHMFLKFFLIFVIWTNAEDNDVVTDLFLSF